MHICVSVSVSVIYYYTHSNPKSFTLPSCTYTVHILYKLLENKNKNHKYITAI